MDELEWSLRNEERYKNLVAEQFEKIKKLQTEIKELEEENHRLSIANDTLQHEMENMLDDWNKS